MAVCPRGGVSEQRGFRRRVTSQHKLTSSDLMKGGKKTLSSWISCAAGLAAPPTAIATCVKAGVWSHAFPDQRLHRFHTLPGASRLESCRCPCRALASTDALSDPAHAGPSKASRMESRSNWKTNLPCVLHPTQKGWKAHRKVAKSSSRVSGESRLSFGVEAQTRAEEAEFVRGGSPQGLSSPCSS